MRYLITVVIAALSLNAFGQGIPQLPYNPDENGDGLIGVPDLQSFLTYYGSEFSAATLAEDLNTAVLYIGDFGYLKCRSNCASLQGPWSMIDLNSAGLILDELNGQAWISIDRNDFNLGYATAISNSLGSLANYGASTAMKCYCDAHQVPKVEYSTCEGTDIQACAEDKVTNGWYPLNGIGYLNHSGYQKVQAFWRWAE